MTNRMINSVKSSQFKMPALICLVIAYFIYWVGDFIGGTLAIQSMSLHSFFRANRDFISLATCIVPAIFLFLWVKYIELRDIKGLGFYKERCLKDTIIGSVAGFLTFSAILFIAKLLGLVTNSSVNLDLKNLFLVVLIIPFWFLQAGAEEVITRGFVLPIVSSRTNKLIGILASSLVFVLFHTNNQGLSVLAIVNIFLIGVLLSLYTLLTDNIWGSIAFHAFWNFTQGTFFGLSVSGSQSMNPSLMTMTTSGNQLLSGGNFGIEASLINTVVIASLIVYVSYKYHKKFSVTSLLKA